MPDCGLKRPVSAFLPSQENSAGGYCQLFNRIDHSVMAINSDRATVLHTAPAIA